jgi:MYXO-CTERM domain-containing protein
MWFILSAWALPTTPNWQALGTSADEYFGQRLATSDIDGDGDADLIVGMYGGCRLDIYTASPAGLSLAPSASVSGPCFEAFGEGFADAGDVNGDGYDDVLIGSPEYDNAAGQVMEGKVSLHLGGPSGLSPTSSWDFESNQPLTRLGESLAGLGDLDGDGYDDFALGAPWTSYEGYVLLFLGSPTGPSSAPDLVLEGAPGDSLGVWLASAGDVNGDGAPDLAAGGMGGPNSSGVARVYAGGPGGVDPTPLWTAAGAMYSYFGLVAGPGDLDGDGYDDLVVGAPFETSAWAAEGAVYVFPGSPTGPSPAPTLTLLGGQERSSFGQALAGGDVDGDGRADLLVGSPRWSGLAGVEEGRVQLFFGTELGLSATAGWTSYGGATYASLGTSGVLLDLTGEGGVEPVAGAPLLSSRAGAVYAWRGSDFDGDGYESPEDCDDEDADIHPGLEDLPEDGIDQDCDGEDAVAGDTGEPEPPEDTGEPPTPDTGEPSVPDDDKPEEDGGCGCASSAAPSAAGPAVLGLLGLFGLFGLLARARRRPVTIR